MKKVIVLIVVCVLVLAWVGRAETDSRKEWEKTRTTLPEHQKQSQQDAGRAMRESVDNFLDDVGLDVSTASLPGAGQHAGAAQSSRSSQEGNGAWSRSAANSGVRQPARLAGTGGSFESTPNTGGVKDADKGFGSGLVSKGSMVVEPESGKGDTAGRSATSGKDSGK
ncbi:MAG: hypothetical protein IAF02_12895 [Anaerolineae bacterium]|nr:hypothetical protein [Anaerolineae bacterium]